jgi:type I phosphodiesterase/nucleotide pyrophosphatase
VSVDDLRQQLRDRGYLTHGIERWFALDPWSSRTFWSELFIVAAKAAILIALFGALPPTAVMVVRNHPLSAFEILALFLSYGVVWLVAAFAFVVVIALVLKVRPALPIDTPRALLVISMVAAAALVAPIAVWWSRFDTAPALPELGVGVVLCVIFFLVASIVVSAALLSFSIYELRRIPSLHQKRRGVPMALAAAVLIALLFVPVLADREAAASEPMVVTTPTTRRVALIAVDGLTWEILQSRPDLSRALPHAAAIDPVPGESTTERWATIGTGVPVEDHGVRAIEGIRFRGGSHILQQISRADAVLRTIARREPLPPTVRRRDYIWEIFAERGLRSVAVNWWATSDEQRGALTSISPDTIFVAAKADPLRLDALAEERFTRALTSGPRFATVYLPALDVILNRLDLDQSTKLARSLRALDRVTGTVETTRNRGYDVVLVGMPGDGQQGKAVLASNASLPGRTPWSIAPAILDAMGFPSSAEMPGAGGNAHIATYGARESTAAAQTVNQEYYDNLKSLGYIR